MNYQADSSTFHGIYPMLYAFWADNGSLDEEAMTRQVEHAIEVGADGIAVLGLVSEAHRISRSERLTLLRLVSHILDRRLPYSVTVLGESAADQISFANDCLDAGADWLVLQPPGAIRLEEQALIDWFANVADGIGCPLGVQNNPEHLLNAFTADGLLKLHAQVPKITILKGEGPAAGIEPLISRSRTTLSTFGGHGGLEHISLLRAGAAGLIPAPDCLSLQVKIHQLWRSGDPEKQGQAVAIQREILPLIVFMNRSIDYLLCYGRQFMAKRLGLTGTTDRFGTIRPTRFGMEEIQRFLDELAKSEARWLG